MRHYVVLRPESKTNLTDKFCVVDFDDWTQYVVGATENYPNKGTYDTHREAKAKSSELNRKRNS